MAQPQWTMDPWKATALGLILVGITAAITTVVVGQRSEPDTKTTTKTESKVHKVVNHRDTQADIDACNQYAENHSKDKTTEMLKDTGIGALGGAGVGAAGGAIAGGGSGAGKGAAIGGIAGAVGGALYGLHENKANDENYRAAYASCMSSRGYK
jgi:hypothetical protein